MSRRLVTVACAALLVLSGARAAAQVPGEGLRAEGEHRWTDALEIYSATLRDHPDRADLWVRVADIQAVLGHPEESIHALEQAAAHRRDDPALFARLSQAYAASGHPGPALLAMEGALALAPGNREYLKAAAQLASWKGDYPAAHDAYLRLLKAHPDEVDAWLMLARVDVWQGQTDRAVGAFKTYVDHRPDDRTAWIEWARAESYRGNDAGALKVLERMRQQLGPGPDEQRELASVLGRAGRPSAALETLQPLIAAAPADADLKIVDGVIRVAYGDERGARRDHEWLTSLVHPRPETTQLERQIRAAFGSVLQPAVNGYRDSDGLHIVRMPIGLALAIAPGFRVEGGYQHDALSARVGSGLESADGRPDQSVDQGWLRVAVRPGRAVQFHLQTGGAQSRAQTEFVYAGGLTVQGGDSLRLRYERDHGLLVISPRAVSLGLTRDTDRVRVAWTPAVMFTLDAEATHEGISDGNTRNALRVAPSFSLLRLDFMNLNIGAAAYAFGAARDLDHGYYDPRRYEAYTATFFPYLKFSENTGLSLFLEAGTQRDSNIGHFRPGGSAVGELTFGIYDAWVLRLNGGVTINNRLESGAFRGATAGAVLQRRF